MNNDKDANHGNSNKILKVKVAFLDGCILDLNLTNSSTGKDVREEISKYGNFPINSFNIYTNSVPIEDNEQLISYGIKNNDKLACLINKVQYRIVCKLLYRSETFEFNIVPNTTFKQLKYLIRNDSKFSFNETDKIKLVENSIVQLDDSIVQFNSCIKIISQIRLMTLTIKRINRNIVKEVKVNIDLQIITLKQLISKEFNMPIEEQSLIYNGEILSNDQYIDSFNFEDRSIILLVETIQHMTKLYIFYDSEVYTLWVEKTKTIGYLKGLIKTTLNQDISVNQLEVIHNDSQLTDNKLTIKNSNIVYNSEIFVRLVTR